MTDVPAAVLRLLLSGWVVGSAELILQDGSPRQGSVVTPGDNVGRVLEWLWQTDPSQCALRVGDLMAQLKLHSPHADPSIGFSELLDGLRFSLPNMTPGEIDKLIDYLRIEVPDYYGGVLT